MTAEPCRGDDRESNGHREPTVAERFKHADDGHHDDTDEDERRGPRLQRHAQHGIAAALVTARAGSGGPIDSRGCGVHLGADGSVLLHPPQPESPGRSAEREHTHRQDQGPRIQRARHHRADAHECDPPAGPAGHRAQTCEAGRGAQEGDADGLFGPERCTSFSSVLPRAAVPVEADLPRVPSLGGECPYPADHADAGESEGRYCECVRYPLGSIHDKYPQQDEDGGDSERCRLPAPPRVLGVQPLIVRRAFPHRMHATARLVTDTRHRLGVSPSAARSLTCRAVRAGASTPDVANRGLCCPVVLAAVLAVWQPSGASSWVRPRPDHPEAHRVWWRL